MLTLITKNELVIMIIVGLYLPALLIISEFLRKKKTPPKYTRKIVHIFAGLVAIPSLYLLSRPYYAYLIAIVFGIIAFLTSRASPLSSIRLPAIEEGHSLGTTYYAISLLFLFFFFFPRPLPIAFGIIALCFGDGFAAIGGWLIPSKHTTIFGSTKSISGTVSAGIASFLGFTIMYYLNQFLLDSSFLSPKTLYAYLLLLALLTILVELFSPFGLDNFTVPLVIATVTYYLFL